MEEVCAGHSNTSSAHTPALTASTHCKYDFMLPCVRLSSPGHPLARARESPPAVLASPKPPTRARADAKHTAAHINDAFLSLLTSTPHRRTVLPPRAQPQLHRLNGDPRRKHVNAHSQPRKQLVSLLYQHRSGICPFPALRRSGPGLHVFSVADPTSSVQRQQRCYCMESVRTFIARLVVQRGARCDAHAPVLRSQAWHPHTAPHAPQPVPAPHLYTTRCALRRRTTRA